MDILLGLLAALLAAAAALGCWRLGILLAARLSRAGGEAAAGVALLLTGGLVALVNHAPSSLPRRLLLSPAIYFEFCYFLPTAAFFFGLASRRVPDPRTGRALGVLVAVLAGYSAVHAFLAFDARSHPGLSAVPPPSGIQRQTTGWSCGPASCVTLLAAHGIRSTEREMGEYTLCYRRRGTTMPRFLRGLALKLRDAGSRLRVRAADHLSLRELEAFPKPCLVGLRLTFMVDHAVVVMGVGKDGTWRVADPIRGTVGPMSLVEMRERFTGEAIALEEGP
ncbi:MAG: hypothetical protein HUU06_14025 [Planctomycetaceae bacterium]|nr:cysteine peptidase family C39 domain-containing protein [Planctomycetota bacterium]NUN53885.1 hypothetical protein [Planctomycetaceae bacterium]